MTETPDQDKPAPGGSASDASGPGTGSAKGSDLAREALAAARARNAQKRAAAGRSPVIRRAGGSTAALRRRRWSGSGPDSARDPQPLGAAFQKWIAVAGAGADLTKAQLFGRWAQIVGEDIAAHCNPVTLVDGELLLQAESTAWATQIRMLAPNLVKRINAELGQGSVKRIRAQGPSGPSWRFGERHVPGRGPRDTYG